MGYPPTASSKSRNLVDFVRRKRWVRRRRRQQISLGECVLSNIKYGILSLRSGTSAQAFSASHMHIFCTQMAVTSPEQHAMCDLIGAESRLARLSQMEALLWFWHILYCGRYFLKMLMFY